MVRPDSSPTGPGGAPSGSTSARAATAPDAYRPIDDRGQFRIALRDAFAAIARLRAREVRLCDDDFADWPLGDPEVIERLTAWAGPGRRLVMLARHYDEVARRHPRWVDWRRTWSHLVVCRTNTERGAGAWPTLFIVPDAFGVCLLDRERPRGWSSSAAHDIVLATEQFDAVSQRSVDAFPASTLGL